MSLLADNNPIIANGNFEVQLWAGHDYLFTTKTTNFDTATIQYQFEDDNGVMQNIDGASEDGTGSMEQRVTVPSSGIINLKVTGKAGVLEIPVTITRVHVN